MLAILMYHRVHNTPFKAEIQSFEKQLETLVQRYKIVVPGQPLSPTRLNVCLTFDDAYYDFYHYVFPLLKKWQIQAVLAVPAGLILDNTEIDSETRLAIPYNKALTSHRTGAALCTWDEINEMLAEKAILLAAHGLTHVHLTEDPALLEREVIHPKTIIKTKTGQETSTFVYPYGRMTRRINRLVTAHYPHAMRIGTALNRGWNNKGRVLYRINTEDFWPKEKPMLTYLHCLNLSLRLANNRLRFK